MQHYCHLDKLWTSSLTFDRELFPEAYISVDLMTILRLVDKNVCYRNSMCWSF